MLFKKLFSNILMVPIAFAGALLITIMLGVILCSGNEASVQAFDNADAHLKHERIPLISDPTGNLQGTASKKGSEGTFIKANLISLLRAIDTVRGFEISNVACEISNDEAVLSIRKGYYDPIDVIQIVMENYPVGLAYYGPGLQKFKDSTEMNWIYPGMDSNKAWFLYATDNTTMVRLKGRVLESETRVPIPYAEIFNECGWGTLSDANGNFILDLDCPSGIWVIGKDRVLSGELTKFENKIGGFIELNILIAKDGTGSVE